MDEKILTKEEYTEKLNSFIKPMVEFAMTTKQFKDKGCYSEEFIKIDESEVTLCVANSDWIIISKDIWDDTMAYKNRYYKLKKEYEEFIKEVNHRKFLGFF